MSSLAAGMATTGVASDTTFSPESTESRGAFWQGSADGVGDQNFRRSGHSPGLARATGPRHRDTLPCPAAVRTLASRQVLDRHGRTALSEHRRRIPGRNSTSHRPAFLLPVTAVAIAAILGVTLAGYLVLRATRPGPGAVIAAALPGSQAMAVLAEQRPQMIGMEGASPPPHPPGIPQDAALPAPPGRARPP